MTYRETAALGQSAGGAESYYEQSKSNEARQWTIKNLDATVVSKARAAAKKSGMKINAWVASALENAADRELLSDETPQRSPLAVDLDTIVTKIESARREEREMIERIEKDISQLMKGQHGMMVEILTRKKLDLE